MAVFNHLRKEIDAKIVYYGPGLSGKTTNLQFIHQNLKPDQRGKMVSLATNEERTLFFDFLPIELESVRGFKTRFHLYTVPGQAYYGATRRAVLSGTDGIIFVADSQKEKIEDNLLSFKDLEENLCYYRKSIENIPLIIQYNKRDLSNISSLEELNQKINRLNVSHFEATAISGKGVFETLTMICRLVLKAIEEGTGSRSSSPKPEMAHEKTPSFPPALGKSVRSVESPRNGPGMFQAGERHVDKKIFPVETTPRIKQEIHTKEIKPPREIFSAKKSFLSSVPEISHSPEIITPKKDMETEKIGGGSFFSRLFGKVGSEPPVKEAEEPQKITPTSLGEMRLISCGEAYMDPAGRLRIPLTLEIEGAAKSFSINLLIHIENVETKGD